MGEFEPQKSHDRPPLIPQRALELRCPFTVVSHWGEGASTDQIPPGKDRLQGRARRIFLVQDSPRSQKSFTWALVWQMGVAGWSPQLTLERETLISPTYRISMRTYWDRHMCQHLVPNMQQELCWLRSSFMAAVWACPQAPSFLNSRIVKQWQVLASYTFTFNIFSAEWKGAWESWFLGTFRFWYLASLPSDLPSVTQIARIGGV